MKMNISYRSVMRKILAVALVLTMVCGMGLMAHAMTVTKELVTLESDMNLAISVTYTDNGSGAEPELTFIAPGGKEYKKGMPEDEMTFDQADNILYFYIPDAETGQWMIRFDDSFSGHLEVTTAPYSRDVLIEEFVIDELTDSYARIHFLTAFPVDKQLDYVVNAVVLDADGTISGTKELYSGWAHTNETVEASVALSDLSSYSEYLLQLVVYVDEYGVEVSSAATTDPFGYDNPNTPDELGDYYVILNRTTGDLQIDWTNVALYNAESYILAVYSSLDESEPVYANTFGGNETSTSVLVDTAADWLRVELSYTYTHSDVVSKPKTVTVHPNDVQFEITTPENTASAQAQISYNVPSGEVELYIYADGETELKPTKVSGSGTLAFTMQDNDNKINVAYKPSDYVVIMETKEIFLDRKAPILTFFEDLGSVTTKEAVFRVAGMTEAGAAVTVNGAPVQINSDGSFLIELNLVNGANSFEIISTDPAGNLSRRTVLINRSDVAASVGSDDVQPFWKTWLPMFIAVGASLALVILILCLFGGKKKLSAAQTLKRWSILTWIFSGVGLGVTVWLLIEKIISSDAVNTTQFFDKVQASFDEAYAALLEMQFYDQWFLIALIVTAVLAVISIGLTVAAVIVGKNQNKPPKPPKAPKPPKPPKAPKPKKEKPVPAPVVEPEVVAEPEPELVVEPEVVAEPEPEPVVEPEVVAEPEPAPVVEPEVVVEPEPAPVVEPEVVVEPEPVVEPEVVAEPEPAPVVEPEVVVEPEPVVEPEIVAKPEPAPVALKFCPNCGHRRVEGAAFCVNCGQKLN